MTCTARLNKFPSAFKRLLSSFKLWSLLDEDLEKFVMILKIFVIFVVICVGCDVAGGNYTCSDLHILYNKAKQLVNIRTLYDNMLRDNHVTMSDNNLGYSFFSAEFGRKIDFNVSEEYLKAKIYTQTASIFYDQHQTDSPIPSLFQNYSHCFIEPTNFHKITREPYRSITGYGNNLKHPKQGKKFTSYGRILKAAYDDQIYSIRKSGRGYDLPTPRNIVRKLFLNDRSHLDKFSDRQKVPNVLFLMFGQMIKHDTGSRQFNKHIDGNKDIIRCCANNNKITLPPSLMHSSCIPIIISKSDTFYNPRDIHCMDFIRSNIISNNPHKIEIGEQVNAVTSYLDLSVIYGSNHKEMKKVRSFNGGRLKMNPGNALPVENGTYYSGDDRVTQTQFLTVIHSLFIRNHNNLSDKLGAINPHWGEEKLFQESRKINIAIYQKIVYEEWLPILMGKEKSRLLAFTPYNPNVDASTLNEFSNSAFRVFHSFIPSEFEVRDKLDQVTKVQLSDALNAEPMVNCLESVLRGLVHQKMSLTGYSSEILNKMFKNRNEVGLDLLSMDILRGRDHGIPAYYRFRKYCNVIPWKLEIFNDLTPHVSKNAINVLRQTYKTVYDIDLLVGGVLEMIEESEDGKNRDEEPLIGPTFLCIMYEQFYRWKAGDFYFYSHKNGKFGFNDDQIKAIRDYKMVNLLCDNSDLSSLVENAFISSGTSVECNNVPTIDLSYWMESTTERPADNGLDDN